MKNKFIIFFILIFSFFFCGAAYETELIDEQLAAINSSDAKAALSDETVEILKFLGVEEADAKKILSLSFKDIFQLVYKSILNKIKEPFKAVFYVTSAVIVCAVIKNICMDFSGTGTVINSVAAIAVSSVILVPIKTVMDYSAKVIGECSDFMLGFIPVYSSLSASCGYVSSAAGYRTLMLGAVTVISRISSEIILPLIGIYFAMCVAGSVSDINISEISKYFKNFCIWVLGILMAVFSGILGLGTLITSSADSSFNKAAKFLIGSTVPIVGSTVSDALSTLKGCLSVTKNVFGVYGIIVTAAIFIPSVITVLSWKICLSAASSVCGMAENKSLGNLLSSASSVLGIMLALLVTTAVMFIFSVTVILLAGGAA